MDFNKKGDLMNIQEIMTDVTNTLNHNGFDEVKTVSNNTDFSVRVGYWEQLPASLIETMEEYHSIRITEHNWEDEDCGMLYRYVVEIVDEDCGYTLNELNELDNYTEEAMYLESVGADDIWGMA